MDAVARRFTWLFAKSQLKLKYRYTSLGFLWNFMEPAIYLSVLSLIFSVINRMAINDYAVFLFGALVPWRYFEKAVNTCMDSIVGGEWLLKKMPVSPFVFPVTRWIVASFEFLFSLIVVFALFAFIKEEWTIHLIVIPLSIIPWAFLGLGVGLICAVAFTFFRDIRPIVQMGLMLIFFSSPILFRADLFEAHSLQSLILRWNPVTHFASLFQEPIYHAAWPNRLSWTIAFAVGAATLALGWALVHRYRGRFYFYL